MAVSGSPLPRPVRLAECNACSTPWPKRPIQKKNEGAPCWSETHAPHHDKGDPNGDPDVLQISPCRYSRYLYVFFYLCIFLFMYCRYLYLYVFFNLCIFLFMYCRYLYVCIVGISMVTTHTHTHTHTHTGRACWRSCCCRCAVLAFSPLWCRLCLAL